MSRSIIVPTNPTDLQKLKQMIEEAGNCLTRIDGENETKKEIIEEISENFELPKKYVNRLVKTAHNRSFDAEQIESEDFSELYEAVYGSNEDE